MLMILHVLSCVSIPGVQPTQAPHPPLPLPLPPSPLPSPLPHIHLQVSLTPLWCQPPSASADREHCAVWIE